MHDTCRSNSLSRNAPRSLFAAAVCALAYLHMHLGVCVAQMQSDTDADVCDEGCVGSGEVCTQGICCDDNLVCMPLGFDFPGATDEPFCILPSGEPAGPDCMSFSEMIPEGCPCSGLFVLPFQRCSGLLECATSGPNRNTCQVWHRTAAAACNF